MNAEDPLFILYTSGSTGKPKGVLHTTGGYLVYASMTHEYVFDYHDGDIYWCTADVGWVTGHSYIVYGPLANGATCLMFEGVPNYPDVSRFWEVVEEAQGQHLLHRPDGDPRPDAGRRRAGEEDRRDLSSAAAARLGRRTDQPGSLDVVPQRGRRRPLPDRRHLVADRDRRHPDHAAARRHGRSSPARRPGRSSASGRCWSMPRAAISSKAPPSGNLCIAHSWPGPDAHGLRRPRALRADLLLDLQGLLLHRRRLPARRGRLLLDHRPGRRRDQRLRPPHGHGGGRIRPGRPSQGGGGRRGRLSARHQGPGHLCLRHPERRRGTNRRAEARSWSPGCARRSARSPRPDWLQWAPGLPKTRSGKIMRRILRKIAEDDFRQPGRHLEAVVTDLVDNRQNRK